MALHVDLFLELRSGGYRSTYNFGEKSTDDDLALLRWMARWTTLLTFWHSESLSLSFFVVITLVVCSLEVLVDVGERGGTQVVVSHGL